MIKDTATLRITSISDFLTNARLSGTPVKLFTATPQHTLCDIYLGGTEHDLVAPLAKNKGSVIQYRRWPASKGVLDGGLSTEIREVEHYIESVLSKEIIDASYLVTFKDTDDYWRDKGFHILAQKGKTIHLKNNSGLDSMKGHDLIIAGKWDKSQIYYQGVYDDISDSGEELTYSNKTFELNGVTQRLYLINEPVIMKLQLETMTQALEQTIGRSRALRCDSTVRVFGNLVTRGVDCVYD